MNPKILTFYPVEIKPGESPKNFLGFCGLQLHISLNGQLIPVITKGRVMRNSNNGHVFITLHQEAYTKADGAKGYSNLIRIPEGKFNEFNKATEKAWDEFILSQKMPNTVHEKDAEHPYYPNSLVRNSTPNGFSPSVPPPPKQYKDNDEDDFR